MDLKEACEQVIKYRKLAKASEQIIIALLPESIASCIHYDGRHAHVAPKYELAKRVLLGEDK
jgi:hypothetical protein